MLELRPTCENCNIGLPPHSKLARICSYECTFCSNCADAVLHNICPNCGGGFVPRPIRPAKNWVRENYLGANPASTKVYHKPINPEEQAKLITAQGGLAPENR